MEEDSEVFVRIWERIHKELQDFGRGFARIYKDLQEIRESLGEDSQGL